MSASFVVGAKKVFAGAEPRFVVLTGDECGLREKLLDELANRSTVEHCWIDGSDRRIDDEVFRAGLRPSKEKCVIIRNAEKIPSWDWLPVWFNKVHRIRLVLETTDRKLAEDLEHKANTRGLVIDCSAPTGDANRTKLVAMLSDWYGQSATQLNIMLSKNDWHITECMQLLDKVKLLRLPLNSDTIAKIGIAFNAREEFMEAMKTAKYSWAMSVCHRIPENVQPTLLVELSDWLDKLSRVKVASGFMKSANDIALEVGLPTKLVAELKIQAQKYTQGKINRMALMIANADRDFSSGYHNGVIELMVNSFE